MILDIFSRYVVAWMIADRERAELGKMLIGEECIEQDIQPVGLTLHADHGPAMTAQPVAQLMVNLGVTKSHTRPYCSNDNPFSESAFKTLKYRPGIPERFAFADEARTF